MVDSNDLKVVVRLMQNARATWAELGALIGLSAPAAADRVRKMEDSGVIRSYAAVVDPEAVGLGLTAFIAVSLTASAYRSNFLALIASLPEVQECHHIAGEADYLLKVRCIGTRHLERLISEQIKCAAGINTKTTIVLSTVKETVALPVLAER
ncbi:MAG: Lrp/AsnC family transcriptional regulator [Sporomusaceae bacterium]|nr:Lrp/AsnC family transcriptional regulator [Sporomusaceae bacterium]